MKIALKTGTLQYVCRSGSYASSDIWCWSMCKTKSFSFSNSQCRGDRTVNWSRCSSKRKTKYIFDHIGIENGASQCLPEY